MRRLLFFLSLLCFISSPILAFGESSSGRFFLEGDGTVRIIDAKSGKGGTIVYRNHDGTYSEKGEHEINRVFGAPSDDPISLRLIALLDYLQDHFKKGTIRLVSGYRSPEYNEGLRKKGKLAAPTSLHIEGMAADIDIDNVNGRTLWNYARSLDCCGAGYYHGKGIHIDTGPVRFWDETSAKVDKNLGGHNKLILLRTDQDIYHPGEKVRLTLSRVTDYPFGIRPVISLIGKEGEVAAKVSLEPANGDCWRIKNRGRARSLSWTIPPDFEKGRLKISLEFCEKPAPEMPDKIFSNLLSIQ
jgi:hypothetical protein